MVVYSLYIINYCTGTLSAGSEFVRTDARQLRSFKQDQILHFCFSHSTGPIFWLICLNDVSATSRRKQLVNNLILK